MQLYRGMDIGTAKLPVSERRGIPHHLLDVLEVTEDAAVAWYQERRARAIDRDPRRGADAILVGGSGLYVSSVLFDFRFPPRDEALRAQLEAELERDGPGVLYERLRAADPTTAERVDPRNGRRIVRALEVLAQGEQTHGAALPDEPVPVAAARRSSGSTSPARRARRAARRARRAHVGATGCSTRSRPCAARDSSGVHGAPRDRLRAGARTAARRRRPRPRRSPRRRRSRAATRDGRCRGSSAIPAWSGRTRGPSS